MKKALKTGLTLTGLAAMAGGFMWARAVIIEKDEALEENPLYVINQTYNQIDSSLKEAQDLLTYTPREERTVFFFPVDTPENFPDPGIAGLALDGALTWYGAIPDRGEQDFILMTDIMDLREVLPNDVEIKTYEGEPVDNTTFAEQRLAIEEVRSEVQGIADDYQESALLVRGIDPDLDDAWTAMYVLGAGTLALLIGLYSPGEKKKDEKIDE